MGHMGYRNANAMFRLNREGRLTKMRKDGVLTTDNNASLLLTYMCLQTYDWDTEHNRPTADAKAKGYPCRYYKRGWRAWALDYGKTLISPEKALSANADKEIAKRENSNVQEFKRAIKFLTEKGVVKRLQNASLGDNAGYLLLLGDDEENRAVERWARQCLNLPMIW